MPLFDQSLRTPFLSAFRNISESGQSMVDCVILRGFSMANFRFALLLGTSHIATSLVWLHDSGRSCRRWPFLGALSPSSFETAAAD